VIRVLVVTDDFPPPWTGGGTTVAATHAELLRAVGCETAILTTRKPSTPRVLGYAVFPEIVPPTVWRNSTPNQLAQLVDQDDSTIRRAIDIHRPDVILLLHMWGVAASSISKLGAIGVPLVPRFGDEWLRLHYCNPCGNQKHGRLDTDRSPLRFQRCIANSQLLAERVDPFVDGANVIVLRNPVDRFRFPFQPANRPIKRMLFVGRLVPHKGVHILLEAMVKMKEKFGTATPILIIVGLVPDPSYLVRLRDYTRNHDLDASVIWQLDVPHSGISSFLANADLVLFPSQPRGSRRTVEGCPNSILEAWATGVPVIASADEHGDLINHGENGLLACPNNPESWLAQIERLSRDRSIREGIISRAYKTVVRNHDFLRYAHRLVAELHQARS
jgi:glycosyltransferase involved in cell wall biosynthesis